MLPLRAGLPDAESLTCIDPPELRRIWTLGE